MVFGGVFPRVLRPAFDAGEVAAAFVGAYDAIPNIVAAYGLRRLLAAYTGSILRIRRSSDNAEQDIGYESDGDLDTATIASFIGAGSGYVRTWYDQSGNAYDAAQTTAANQPLYVASGQNGRPVGRWDGSNDKLITGTFSPVISFPYTVFVITKANFGTSAVIYGTVSPARHELQWNSTSQLFLWSGQIGVIGGIATNWNIIAIKWDGASSIVNLNGGGNISVNPGVAYGTTASGIILGDYSGGGVNLDGDIAELIICSAALSDANRQAAEAAANNYWAVY